MFELSSILVPEFGSIIIAGTDAASLLLGLAVRFLCTHGMYIVWVVLHCVEWMFLVY